MSNRRKIVAGNWKMNKDYEQGRTLAQEIVAKLQPSDTVVVLGTPYIHLKGVAHIISNINNLHLSAQNCHQEENGAYTGEIAASMLKSVGCDFVILGHSERREYFEETDTLIASKIKQAQANGLQPIFCCGEKLPSREAGEQEAVVGKQVEEALFGFSAEEVTNMVIAYEPVWAIGTGVTASPAQAQEMHAYIRGLIRNQFGDEVADSMSILYGGSVKPANAKELFSQPDVDGGLVGGASLKAEDFLAIIESI